MKTRTLCGTIILASLSLAANADAAELRIVSQLATAGTGRREIAVRISGAPDGTVVKGFLRCGNETVKSELPARSDVLVFEVSDFGLYSVEAAAVAPDGTTNAIASTTYSVVPAVKERPREFGVCAHFMQGKGTYPLTFDLMRLVGVSRIRGDLAWEGVERSPGVYAIPDRADALVSRCEEYGIMPLFVFGYPNAKCYPNGFKGKPFPTDDATRKACANALAFAVRRYGRRVPAWELWNEPNYADPVKDYLPLLKFAYPAVKAACPEVKLISGGGSGAGGGIGGGFIDPVLRAVAQDFQDGWSIHPYMAPYSPDHGYEAPTSPTIKVANVEQSCRYMLERANKCRRSDGKALEPWITEIGWTSAKVSDERQAAYLARSLLLYRRHAPGVPVYLYDFQNDGNDPKDNEQNFGLIRKDNSPKPSFQSVAVAASKLANRSFVGALLEGESRVYGYGTDGKPEIYAAWTADNAERSVEISLPDGMELTELVDWQGRAMPVGPDSVHVTLPLSASPCWLSVKQRGR